MRLTILGSSTPYPRPGNPCSGYLVQSDQTNIWVDAGTGTLAELQRHLALDKLHAIWISHTHADHTADLLAAYYAFRFADLSLEQPIPLFGPPELMRRLESFLGSNSSKLLPTVFDYTEMKRSNSATIGDLSLGWRKVRHGVPAFGLRVKAPDASLAYSGDTAKCDEVVTLARDSTALLCEVGYRELPESDIAHTTPKEAGEMATESGSRRLIVTHIGEGMSGEYAAARAGATFTGPIDVARPGEVFALAD